MLQRWWLRARCAAHAAGAVDTVDAVHAQGRARRHTKCVPAHHRACRDADHRRLKLTARQGLGATRRLEREDGRLGARLALRSSRRQDRQPCCLRRRTALLKVPCRCCCGSGSGVVHRMMIAAGLCRRHGGGKVDVFACTLALRCAEGVVGAFFHLLLLLVGNKTWKTVLRL